MVQPAVGNTLDRHGPEGSDGVRTALDTVPGDSRDVWTPEVHLKDYRR